MEITPKMEEQIDRITDATLRKLAHELRRKVEYPEIQEHREAIRDAISSAFVAAKREIDFYQSTGED